MLKLIDYYSLITPFATAFNVTLCFVFSCVSRYQLRLAHVDRHLDQVASTAHADTMSSHGDMYANRHSAAAAKVSAGICVEAVAKVCSGEVSNAVAVIRPPGHHAEPDGIMGFCMYNNVAVAAKVAQRDFGIGKVMIVDW